MAGNVSWQVDVSSSHADGADGGGPRVAVAVFLVAVSVVSVAGNSLVCAAVWRARALRKLCNTLYVSLALADLLVGSAVVWTAAVREVTHRWIFSAALCDLWLSMDVMCSTASILNICAISLDRYVHIRDVFHYKERMSRRRIAALISTIWLLSGTISFLPIYLGWHNKPPGPGSGSGTDAGAGGENVTHAACDMDLNPVYAIISSMLSFFTPCFIMIYLYFRLFLYARRTAHRRRRTYSLASQPSGVGPGPGEKAGAEAGPKAQPRRDSLADHKAAITLGIIMGSFLFCWLPFFTVNIIQASCGCVLASVYDSVTWLGYFNSCINPIIYTKFNSDFRNAFRNLLCPIHRKRFRRPSQARRNTQASILLTLHAVTPELTPLPQRTAKQTRETRKLLQTPYSKSKHDRPSGSGADVQVSYGHNSS